MINPPEQAIVQVIDKSNGDAFTGVVVATGRKGNRAYFEFECVERTPSGQPHILRKKARPSDVVCMTLNGGTTQLQSWQKAGTNDFGRWKLGGRIKSLETLNAGDVLFNESHRFDALNLMRITRTCAERGIVYGAFVSPHDVSLNRTGGTTLEEFAIWDFEINIHNGRTRLYSAVLQDHLTNPMLFQ